MSWFQMRGTINRLPFAVQFLAALLVWLGVIALAESIQQVSASIAVLMVGCAICNLIALSAFVRRNRALGNANLNLLLVFVPFLNLLYLYELFARPSVALPSGHPSEL